MNFKHSPLLLIDFYKATHAQQYPKDISCIYSPYTPRLSRLPGVDKVTFFGCQAFCKEYLITMFNENFFNRDIEEVVAEYERVLTYTLGPGTYNADNIRKLHNLGYLPIAIYAVPEGTQTAIGVPQSVFVNTHPDFAWLTNTLETAYSCFMWHIQISAEVGYKYRQIVEKYHQKTCESNIPVSRLLGDFSMRGQHSPEAAIHSSAGWLLSFVNTATVPAIMWLEDNYNCNISEDEVGYGAISTEHSVMCSNYAVDGDEITHIKRLLTEIYPNNNFSMVSDSYDYWRLVTELLPQCKKEIMAHNGCLSIRGDSGDPIEVIAGKEFISLSADEEDWLFSKDKRLMEMWARDFYSDEELECSFEETLYVWYNDKPWSVTIRGDATNERGAWTDKKYWYVEDFDVTVTELEPTAELLGTVWALWQEFGGTINEKGYKVLDPHVKAIYGDSITPYRCEEIYRRLEEQGFSIQNVTLGVGSFSFMCLEEINQYGESKFYPYTRDTFGVAIKATYAEDKNNNPIMIYKNPKALSWKKSQKGCCVVALDGTTYTDEHTFSEAHEKDTPNLLQLVFKDGEMIKEYSLKDIRNTLHKGEF